MEIKFKYRNTPLWAEISEEKIRKYFLGKQSINKRDLWNYIFNIASDNIDENININVSEAVTTLLDVYHELEVVND